VVISGRGDDLPRLPNVDYVAGHDTASGSGGDSDALAIAHAEFAGDRMIVVVDAIRETRPPYSPELVVAERAALLRAYEAEIHRDKWATGYVDALYARHGQTYRPLPMSKSEVYVQFLGLVTSRRGRACPSIRDCSSRWRGGVDPSARPDARASITRRAVTMTSPTLSRRLVLVHRLASDAVNQAPVQIW
jgi:hypothetical protein